MQESASTERLNRLQRELIEIFNRQQALPGIGCQNCNQPGAATNVDWHAEFFADMKQYQEFHRLTGIRASRVERIALAKLLLNYPFDVREVEKAWKDGALYFEGDQLKVRIPKWRNEIAMAILLVSLLLLSPLLMRLVYGGGQAFEMLACFSLFVFALIFVSFGLRNLIAPARAAKRLHPVVVKINGS